MLRFTRPFSFALHYSAHLSAPCSSLTNVRALHMTAKTSASDAITAKIAALIPEQPVGLAPANNATMLARVARDLRSDTLTIPDDEMFDAMRAASRGDDVFSEDDTSNAFEKEIAALAGKEAGLFVMSGTLSNQIAIRTHLHQPPYSILLDVRGHIQNYEAGGAAFHSGALQLAITPKNGHHLTLRDDILPNLVRGNDIHSAPTRLICLENSLHGTIFPQDEIVRIAAEAHHPDTNIPIHLDGARIWNVAAASGISIKELCEPFDSVSVCFSKGLGAPIGSMLLGKKAFIAKARHFRKLFGSGARQTGSIAAAARIAVLRNYPKLIHSHELVQFLATELTKLGVKLERPAETNMLWINTDAIGFGADELSKRALQLPNPIRLGAARGRLVVHYQVTQETADDIVALVKTMKEEAATRDPKVNGTEQEVNRGDTSMYAAMKE